MKTIVKELINEKGNELLSKLEALNIIKITTKNNEELNTIEICK